MQAMTLWWGGVVGSCCGPVAESAEDLRQHVASSSACCYSVRERAASYRGALRVVVQEHLAVGCDGRLLLRR